jgi:hypothetical protein
MQKAFHLLNVDTRHKNNNPAGRTSMRQGKIVDEYGTIRHYKDDQLHRDNDLPAIISEGGTRYWYQNGLQHRVVGAAMIYADGEEFYFIDDKKLTKEQHANHPEVKKYRLQQILNRLTV